MVSNSCAVIGSALALWPTSQGKRATFTMSRDKGLTAPRTLCICTAFWYYRFWYWHLNVSKMENGLSYQSIRVKPEHAADTVIDT